MKVDRIITSVPLNSTAAKVVSGRGEHWTPDYMPSRDIWETPPPMRRVPTSNPTAAGIVGLRTGRLVVVGLYDGGSKNHKSSWVVRCDCGRYELRKARALRNPENTNDKCQECDHLERIRTNHYAKKPTKMQWERT